MQNLHKLGPHGQNPMVAITYSQVIATQLPNMSTFMTTHDCVIITYNIGDPS